MNKVSVLQYYSDLTTNIAIYLEIELYLHLYSLTH